jgi:DNA invertase Pin-like site-specific DNA recombinase
MKRLRLRHLAKTTDTDPNRSKGCPRGQELLKSRCVLELVDTIRDAGASLRILAMNLDTGTPTGKLMLNVLGSVAEFERTMMLERQREGIAKAKSEGKYIGRKPTALAKAGEVKALAARGVRAVDIAKRLGICRASVYRALRVA